VAGLPFELLVTDDRDPAAADDVQDGARVRALRARHAARAQHVGETADGREHGPAGHGIVVLDRHAALAFLQLGQLAERRLGTIPRVHEERRRTVVHARADGADDAGAEPLEVLALRTRARLD